MTEKLLMTVHSGISLDYLIERVKEDPSVMNAKGKPATKDDLAEILSELYFYKAKGYEVFPMCDNINKKGICKGHKTEVDCYEKPVSWKEERKEHKQALEMMRI